MSPHLGQGANLALLDACRLADALETARDLPQALRYYARRRGAELRLYSAASLLLTPFFQSDGVVKGLGRDLALPLLLHVPLLRRSMLLTAAGLQRNLLGRRIDV
jgi:2-polyprenyl-6-methoxyphenol hydroxylase-like FAD-dependent oxidoreductase